MTSHSRRLSKVVGRARRDPAFFFREVLGWQPWSGQVEIAEAVRDAIAGDGPNRIAVRSGNGVGKTAIAARIMLWVLRCYRDSVVITTAPTSRQVTELLWREARDAYHASRYPLGGRFYDGKPQWELGPRRFALGMSPENTRPERFQGFHAGLILFVADEASGVPEAHWEAIKGSLLAGKAVLLAIGNPTRLHGEFYEAFHRNAHLWRRLHISALETPNLSGQGVPVPGLVTREGVKQAIADWGEDSPLYQVRILGQFPAAASSQLIRLDWVESAVQRYRDLSAHPELSPRRESRSGAGFAEEPALGVDVARSGSDETVLALLAGDRLERLETWVGQDTMKTAGVVKAYADEYPGLSIAIDDGGVGGGVVDRLRELDVAVYPIKFGAAPDGRLSVHFKNKLSEMYWVLREWLQNGRLSLLDDARLAAQLTQLEWEQESDRAIRVYKRGKGKDAGSPDRADALALALEAQLRRQRGAGLWV